jgi:hypothetical protein
MKERETRISEANRPAGTKSAAGQADWPTPQPEHLPAPTYWPAVMAFGTTMLLWGVVASWIISGVGLALTALALAGWIGDIRNEQR